jgi:hypothetical protein
MANGSPSNGARSSLENAVSCAGASASASIGRILRVALLRREETMATPQTDSGSGVTVKIESTDCVDSRGCVPDEPDDFMRAKNENIG